MESQIKKDFGFDFVFFHNTFDDNITLIKILNDGEIKIGSKISTKQRKLSGGEAMPYVFAMMQFDDLINLENMYGGATLIISPKIIYDMDIYFNGGWRTMLDEKSIAIKKNDDTIHKKDKIKIIHDLLEYKMKNKDRMYYMSHEVLFPKNIDIKKYVIGIICQDGTKQTIKQIIHDKGYYIKDMSTEYIITHNKIINSQNIL